MHMCHFVMDVMFTGTIFNHQRVTMKHTVLNLEFFQTAQEVNTLRNLEGLIHKCVWSRTLDWVETKILFSATMCQLKCDFFSSVCLCCWELPRGADRNTDTPTKESEVKVRGQVCCPWMNWQWVGNPCLRKPLRVSSSYFCSALPVWNRVAGDRQRSTGSFQPQAEAASKALIDTFRGSETLQNPYSDCWMKHVSKYIWVDALCLTYWDYIILPGCWGW